MVTVKKPAGIVITVGGLHGTGKSTYSKALSKIFGLRHVSAGSLFRKIAKERCLTVQALTHLAKEDRQIDENIDEIVKREAEMGNVIIDGLLAAWMAGKAAHVKVFLCTPEEVRFKRIASRDKLPYETAKRLTVERESIEQERYKRFYNLDIGDLTQYDIILNTGYSSLNSNIKTLTRAIEEYLKEHERIGGR